jgi:Uma2 family endonuclease
LVAVNRSSDQDDAAPILVRHKMTATEYFALPDPHGYNLIDGALYRCGEPGIRHDEVLAAVAAALAGFVQEAGGRSFVAPMACVLGDGTVLQPDAAYVSPGREALAQERMMGAPDLVIEVLSKATRRFDSEEKLAAYARNGVREAWLVDPDNETVVVYCGDGSRWMDRQLVNFGADIPSEVVSVDEAGLLALRR